MAKKINTLEKFYNHLCDGTSSTWTGIVLENDRHLFQDFCPNLSYVDTIEGVIKGIKGAEFVGLKDDMAIVLFDAKEAN